MVQPFTYTTCADAVLCINGQYITAHVTHVHFDATSSRIFVYESLMI